MKSTGLASIRILTGALFLYLGWLKTQDPVMFLKTIREFDVFTAPVHLNIVAAWLPWFEVWCGMLLILGVAVQTTALTTGLLLVGFTGMILWRASQVYAAGGIAFCAIQFDCGCGSGEVKVCYKLLQNTLLALCCMGMAFVRDHRWALWPKITFPTPHAPDNSTLPD
jgi:uncharacterized membrane protein YphA (DoxX/SURF4 family)